jgi:hypothetical protein
MVFHFYSEALFRLIVRGSLRDCPRAKDAIHFEPEIEVEISGGVLVNDEKISGDGRDGPERFGCSVWRPFGAIAG